MQPYISSLRIKGFKAFGDTSFDFGRLEVIAGANGSGKTSLFELLRFVRDASREPIPPEIVKGSPRKELFHTRNDESFQFSLNIDDVHTILKNKPIDLDVNNIVYSAHISGPVGNPEYFSEILHNRVINTDIDDRNGYTSLPKNRSLLLNRPIFDMKQIWRLSVYFDNWRFYTSLTLESLQMRQSRFVEQNPQLDENGGNISAVLHFLMTEHPDLFDELHVHLRNIIPSFKRITVKARGGPGEVLAYWQEEGLDRELTIADLSDGTIRLICWIALSLHPNPPSLICIDEPELGIHPRALPVLAGLFMKASERTQLLIATHSSYLLTLFDIGDIAVMKKKDGDIVYAKPKDSAALKGVLEDFGPEEIEAMHRSDELEALS